MGISDSKGGGPLGAQSPELRDGRRTTGRSWACTKVCMEDAGKTVRCQVPLDAAGSGKVFGSHFE